MLQSVMQLMQVIAQNQNLMAAFMQKVDMNRLLMLLFKLSNVDITQMEPSSREKLIQEVTNPMMQQQQAAMAQPQQQGPGAQQMGNVAQMMGVAAPQAGAGPGA